MFSFAITHVRSFVDDCTALCGGLTHSLSADSFTVYFRLQRGKNFFLRNGFFLLEKVIFFCRIHFDIENWIEICKIEAIFVDSFDGVRI